MEAVGGWTTTQVETRYGCFLPDLTGLARDLPAANLPGALYQDRAMTGQGPSAGRLPGGAPYASVAHR